ncbi:hypothetical protein [Candidatus Halobonum tyrrellensis]|uniref:Uncharacterized protein n=1 Tax=Candidatus Halobonum tyrrellensis G22 TaxID=1324957 RepID=V4HQK8_9EURY|nr:hypothetical protein [Candidatus Halobonum tyrrellensis]ESP90204.1 hypothetical protein K933_00045 [Candidatus Halobonum tyrrellensis G22]
MESRRPAHVLAEEVVIEERYRDRPVVVCGPPRAPGATGTPLEDIVDDDDGAGAELVSTFFRGFTTTRLDGDASEWRLPSPGDGLEWGVRDGWVGFSTDQSCFGGPDRADDVSALLEGVIDALLLVERSRFGAE